MESQTLTNAEANRVFWDSASSTFYESLIVFPNVMELYQKITKAILSRYKFNPEDTTLMDFACGNGPLSLTLSPHCKAIVGVDVSQGMVDGYNKRMQDHGITKATALRAELKPDEPQLSGRKFDAILCSQSYKHIEDNAAITNTLRSYLKPGGVLLVVDVIRGKLDVGVVADMRSLAAQTMPHVARPSNLMSHMNGYEEEEMKALFEGAGLIDFTFEVAFEKKEDERCFGLFLAKGACP